MSDDTVNIAVPREGVALVEFVGEHDLADKANTLELLERLVVENELTVVDLCSTTFIDSSFLNCLMIADKHATERDHQLRVYIRDSPSISAVLKMSGIADHISVVNTSREALA